MISLYAFITVVRNRSSAVSQSGANTALTKDSAGSTLVSVAIPEVFPKKKKAIF
jgi:hypothetical protein